MHLGKWTLRPMWNPTVGMSLLFNYLWSWEPWNPNKPVNPVHVVYPRSSFIQLDCKRCQSRALTSPFPQRLPYLGSYYSSPTPASLMYQVPGLWTILRFWLNRSGVGPEICISNQPRGMADVCGPGDHTLQNKIRAVVLRPESASETPKGLFKHKVLGSTAGILIQ